MITDEENHVEKQMKKLLIEKQEKLEVKEAVRNRLKKGTFE